MLTSSTVLTSKDTDRVNSRTTQIETGSPTNEKVDDSVQMGAGSSGEVEDEDVVQTAANCADDGGKKASDSYEGAFVLS